MRSVITLRAISLAMGAALALAALTVFVVQNVQWQRVPSDDDWREAADSLSQLASSHDPFRVEPAWDYRPRVFLGTRHFIPAKNATWFDTAPFNRVWILAERERRELALEHMPAGWQLDGARTFGGVMLLETSPTAPDDTLWDIFTGLSDANVSRTRGKHASPCNRFISKPSPQWRCKSSDPLSFVGETTKLLTNDVHRCLWAMPTDKAGVLSISFDNVPLGRNLRGHYGLTLDAIRSFRGDSVSFTVLVNDVNVLERNIGLHDEGFPAFEVDTDALGETGKLSFVIKSDDHLDRQFCFVARTIR